MSISKHIYKVGSLSLALALGLVGSGCHKSGGPTNGANGLSTKNEVVWYISADIERMNPFLSTDESANYVQAEIWEPLNGAYPREGSKLMPLLASVPEISADHLTYTYTMDPKAHWSDGKPVTGADVIFSMKTALNPKVINSQALRGYFVSLDSAYYPNGDQTKVAFHINKYRYDAPIILGGGYVKIMPKHIFDPTNLSDKMPWSELHNSASTNAAIQEFATFFESSKIARDPKYLVGSGPYKFKDWITNDRVILQRDSNYWALGRPWLENYPDQIVFKTIKDQNAALTALKSKDIDIMLGLSANQYLTQLDTTSLKYLKKDTVYENVYSYMAWNNLKPIFKDKNTRKALTMLINRDEILTSIMKNMGKKIDGPVSPTQPNFDPTVKQPAFNLDAGKKLLTDNGWGDSDGDGILDKMIDGKRTPFKFNIMIPGGSDVVKQVALVISNQLKKAGIEASVTQIEWSVFLENSKSHNYDAVYSSWVGNMIEDEISQLWESSQSKNKGSNYYSYNNPEADKIMEAIKVEPDQQKRFQLSHQLQHMIVDDQPVTFMFSPPTRIAWVDRFDNVEFIASRPPFDPRWWVVRGAGVKLNPNGIPMSMGPHPVTPAQQGQ